MTDDDKALVERLREEADEWDEPKSRDDFDMRGLLHGAADEIERLREALRSAIRNIDNLTYDIKCHTECAECQSNVAMYEHAVEEYRAALGETE